MTTLSCKGCPLIFGIPFFIPVIMLAMKFLVYGNLRMIYTMSPFLEGEWNVTTAEMAIIVASGEFGALPAGLLAPLSDAAGPQKSVTITGLIVALANLAIVYIPVFPALIISRFISNIAATVFAASLQGAVSTMVEQRHHVQTTGVLEAAWGGSLLLGIPASGYLFNNFGWEAPFLAVSGILAPLTLLLACFLPSTYDVDGDEERTDIEDAHQGAPTAHETQSGASQQDTKSKDKGFVQTVKTLFSLSVLRYYFFAILLVQFAHNFMYASFAYWAVDLYNRSIEETSLVTTLIGVAELSGVAVMSAFGNRMSLVDAVVVAMLFATCATFATGFAGTASFWGGVAGFMCMYFFMEFVIVSSIANVRTLAPSLYQVAALGFFFQSMSIGRTLAAFISPISWEALQDLRYTSVVSTGMYIIVIYSFWKCRNAHLASLPSTSEKQEVDEEDSGEQESHDHVKGEATETVKEDTSSLPLKANDLAVV